MGRNLQQQIEYINGPGREAFLDVKSKPVGINTEMDLLRATADNRFLGMGPFGKNAAEGAAEKDPTYSSAEHQQMAAAQVKIIDEQFGGDINQYKQFVGELAQDPQYANKDFFELVTSGEMAQLATQRNAPQNAPSNKADPVIPASPTQVEPDTPAVPQSSNTIPRMTIEGSGQEVMGYSEEVVALQTLLVEKGFDIGTYPEGHPKAGEPMIDGLMGPKTRAATNEAAEAFLELPADENGKTLNEYIEEGGRPGLNDLENMPIGQMIHTLAEFGSELGRERTEGLDMTENGGETYEGSDVEHESDDPQYTVEIQDPNDPSVHITVNFATLDDMNDADWDSILSDHGIESGTDLSQLTVGVYDNLDGHDLTPITITDLGSLSVNEIRPSPMGEGYSMTTAGYAPPQADSVIPQEPEQNTSPVAPTL